MYMRIPELQTPRQTIKHIGGIGYFRRFGGNRTRYVSKARDAWPFATYFSDCAVGSGVRPFLYLCLFGARSKVDPPKYGLQLRATD